LEIGGVGGYGQMFEGVNIPEAQIYIKKHFKKKKIWGGCLSTGEEGVKISVAGSSIIRVRQVIKERMASRGGANCFI